MTYPKVFYYYKKSSEIEFNRIPHGGETPDFNRMTKDLPAWKKLQLRDKARQKALVLADWTATSCGTQEIKQVKQIIAQLLSDGFPVYVWKKGRFITLKKENLDLLDNEVFRKKITPCQEEQIIQAISEQSQYLHDEILILNDYWLKQLSEPNSTLMPREIDFNKIRFSTHEYQTIIPVLKTTMPKIEKILLTEFPFGYGNKALASLKEQMPDVPIVAAYKTLDCTRLIARQLLEKKSASCDGQTITLEDIKEVETFTLEGALHYLNDLLAFMPQLNDLRLKKIVADLDLEAIHNHAHHLENLTLLKCTLGKIKQNYQAPQLKYLRLMSSKVSDKDFLHLLQGLNHLHSLEINDLMFSTNILPETNYLPELETLQLVAISEPTLVESLLCNKPYLKSIILKNCTFPQAFSSPISLPALESLEVTNCGKINAQHVYSLIHSASRLKNLSLNKIDLTQLNVELNLPELEVLKLEKCIINEDSLKSLLQHASKLKEIDFDGCTFAFKNKSLLSNLPLSSLKKLMISGGAMLAEDLEALLQPASNLDSLTLRMNLSDNFSSALQLPKLSDLNVGTINASQLESLLTATLQLQKLYLWVGGDALAKESFEKDLYLPELKQLDLQDWPISADNFKRLTNSANKLKSINIHIAEIENDLDKNLHFPALQRLSLNSSKTSSHNINLLIRANRLKTFSLDGCEFKPREEFNTSALEKLNLCPENYFFKSDLEDILQSANNLKYLTISKIDFLTPMEINLKKLKKVELSSLTLDAENLMNFLAAPDLEVLEMYSCELWDELPEHLFLPSLHTLILRNSQISEENLIKLMKAAPNLLKIVLPPMMRASFGNPKLKALLEKNAHLLDLNLSAADPENALAEAYQRTDPKYNPKKCLNTPPPPDPKNFQFKYEGKNATKNQGMIIEKLSQYLSLTQSPDQKYISEMQTGICVALSHLFNKKSLSEWDDIVNTLSQWNGQNPLSEHLHVYCSEIMQEYKKAYFEPITTQHAYLGENFFTCLENSSCTAFVFNNFRHAIAVKYCQEEQTWVVYDSKFSQGYKKANKEELKQIVTDCLGQQIFVTQEPGMTYPKPLIQDKNAFIQDGGLYALLHASQADLELLMSQLPRPYDLLEEALQQGLLIRNVNAVPAWKQGLESRQPLIHHYTKALIRQFAIINPNQYAELLAQSMDHLSEAAKNRCITELLSLLISEPWAEILYEKLLSKQDETYFSKLFTTWDSSVVNNSSAKDYYQHLLQQNKRLVTLSSPDDVQAMGVALQQYAHDTQRPVYYINSPEDIVCSTSYIESQPQTLRKEKIGIIKPGPGGPLHQFLTKSSAPLLIVNYDRFAKDDFIRLNNLLNNEDPKADGTALPAGTTLIGLINANKLSSFKDNSFTSRFGLNGVETCPDSIQFPLAPKIQNKTKEMKELFNINFCHANNWKERLLGRWTLKESLVYEEGILQEALDSGRPINLKNGLWDNEEFQHFWYRAQLLGYIEWEGKRYDLKGHSFYQSEGYNWNKLGHSISSIDNRLDPHAELLNPTYLSEFFDQYQCSQAKQLIMLPGLIEQHHQHTLSVNITRQLSDDEWAMLLLECKKHQVLLECHCAPSISLPKACQITPATLPAEIIHSPHRVIESTDVDATLAQLHEEKNDWDIIDISECESSDLLKYIQGEFHAKEQHFTFSETECVVLQALKGKRNVILKGKFSPELADALARLLLNKEAKKGGHLILLSEDASLFNYMPIEKQEVTAEEKKAILLKQHPDETNRINSLALEKPLCQLNAKIAYAEAFGAQKENPWEGLTGLSGGIQLKAFDQSKSQEIADDFISKRQQAVNALLAKSPYVFLTGLSGVGKSTFVEKHFAKESLYIGEAQILDWVKDDSKKPKILFIDEANITGKQWSEFEGLFHNPPSILINKTLYPLSPEHKVIFAGNPLNYGGERHMASLFARHGAAIIFEPMPLEFIYEKILKPVFAQTDLDDKVLLIAQQIFSIYQFLCQCSQDELLISPRELQMIALLVLNHHKQHPEEDISLIVKHYAFFICKNWIPAIYRKEFQQKFSLVSLNSAEVQAPREIGNGFILTASRQPIYQYLDDLISLREYRRQNSNRLNEAQLYGGLGAFIIEGEPGNGKSEFIYNYLIEKLKLNSLSDQVPEQNFYYISADMPPDAQAEKLIEAFHQGAIVLVDEINSIPLKEQQLNELLMGKITTLKGIEHPHRPGFMIIGTQNPASMGGRYQLTNALGHRICTQIVPPYPEEELVDILKTKKVADKAQLMVNAYQKQLKYARLHHLYPEPTVRGLMDAADLKNSPNNNLRINTLKNSILHTFFGNTNSNQESVYISPAVELIKK